MTNTANQPENQSATLQILYNTTDLNHVWDIIDIILFYFMPFISNMADILWEMLMLPW